MATAPEKIDETSFAGAKPLGGAPAPKPAGTTQKLAIPPKSKGFVAVRAVDEQGNVGRVVSVKAKAPSVGGSCANRLRGTAGPDRLHGTADGDRIEGRAGNDRIDGRSGDDCVRGGEGSDRLDGGAGKDRINGGGGADRIAAADGVKDRIRCGSGRDRVTADRKDRVNVRCEKVVLDKN